MSEIQVEQTQSQSRPQDPGHEAHRRTQFLAFLRWVQWATLLSAIALAAIGYVTNVPQLIAWGGCTLVLYLASVMSSRWARHPERLDLGVYVFSGAVVVVLMLNPLLLSGLLPIILFGNMIAVILVGFFVSPSLVLRMTAVSSVFSIVVLFLELWAPFSAPRAPALAIAFFTLVAFLFVGFLIYLFGDILARALATSQDYARELEQSQADLMARTQELETTAADLAARSEELQTTYRQIERNARQSQQRVTALEAIVEVSRAVTQIHDPAQLLPQITQLISQYLGFYHVGIFLLDETGRSITLRAANSPRGRRMVAQRHRVRVGDEDIVNYVMSTGRARTALDTGDDYFDNPDLPDTRSQAVLPLYSGRTAIGVLDVQSTQEQAFDEQDIGMLTTLADQVAIAIENARLFQQNQAALARAEDAYRRYIRQEWDSFLRPGQTPPGATRSSTPGDTRTREVHER